MTPVKGCLDPKGVTAHMLRSTVLDPGALLCPCWPVPPRKCASPDCLTHSRRAGGCPGEVAEGGQAPCGGVEESQQTDTTSQRPWALRRRPHFSCRLQHVRGGHRGLALWLLENNEVEPGAQVGPCSLPGFCEGDGVLDWLVVGARKYGSYPSLPVLKGRAGDRP